MIPYVLLCTFSIGHGGFHGSVLSNWWRHRFTFHSVCSVLESEKNNFVPVIRFTCEDDFPPAELTSHFTSIKRPRQKKATYQGESREAPLFKLLQHSLIWLEEVANIKFKGGSPLLRATALPNAESFSARRSKHRKISRQIFWWVCKFHLIRCESHYTVRSANTQRNIIIQTNVIRDGAFLLKLWGRNILTLPK